MDLIRQSPEVYVARGPISALGRAEVAFLKAAALASPRGRARINAHSSSDDRLHEMLIAIRPKSYIRPHKHPGKSEAFHMVYGEVDIVVFDDAGDLRQIVSLSADNSAASFYYRMSAPMFHTLLIRSDILVVHEITNGPFVAGETVLAPFAPSEDDNMEAERFMADLRERAERFAKQR